VKIKIYYFSGTGNSAWVVSKLSKCLEDMGNDVNALSCEHENAINSISDECDLIGIVFPIHSSFAPVLFQQFLEKFPKVIDKPMFVIATVGFIGGDVTRYSSKILETKGYKSFQHSNIILGNNLQIDFA